MIVDFKSTPLEPLALKARVVQFEQEWRGASLVAVTFGRVGEPEPVLSPRYAHVGDAALFLNILSIDVRQHTILEPGQKHGVPFQTLSGMDRRQHHRIVGQVAKCARLIGDPALELGERLTGQREFDDGIDDRMLCRDSMPGPALRRRQCRAHSRHLL